jgi:hypothetical protein
MASVGSGLPSHKLIYCRATYVKRNNYRNAVKTAVSLYPFAVIVLLLFPGYRRLPKEILAAILSEDFLLLLPIFLVMGGLSGLSYWALSASNTAHGMGKDILGLLGVPALRLCSKIS